MGLPGPVGPAGTGAYGELYPSFAGFTTATFSGNIGGRHTAHGICEAQFPGSHLCHASEYIVSVGASGMAIPAAGAWLDQSISAGGSTSAQHGSPSHGRYIGVNTCFDWTSAGTNSGTVVEANGGMNTVQCSTVRPLACCDTVARVQFVGFTSADVLPSAAGRPAMHAACAAELPGSYMCHAAEYILAASSDPIPANGAWLDPSVDANGNFWATGGAPGFGRYLGSNACFNWTTPGTNGGTMVEPDGGITSGGVCNVARRIACCAM